MHAARFSRRIIILGIFILLVDFMNKEVYYMHAAHFSRRIIILGIFMCIILVICGLAPLIYGIIRGQLH